MASVGKTLSLGVERGIRTFHDLPVLFSSLLVGEL